MAYQLTFTERFQKHFKTLTEQEKRQLRRKLELNKRRRVAPPFVLIYYIWCNRRRQAYCQLIVPLALHVSGIFTEADVTKIDPSHFFSVAVTRAVAPVVERLWFS